MTVEKVTMYRSNDGSVHETEEWAEAHDLLVSLRKGLERAMVDPYERGMSLHSIACGIVKRDPAMARRLISVLPKGEK